MSSRRGDQVARRALWCNAQRPMCEPVSHGGCSPCDVIYLYTVHGFRWPGSYIYVAMILENMLRWPGRGRRPCGRAVLTDLLQQSSCCVFQGRRPRVASLLSAVREVAEWDGSSCPRLVTLWPRQVAESSIFGLHICETS